MVSEVSVWARRPPGPSGVRDSAEEVLDTLERELTLIVSANELRHAGTRFPRSMPESPVCCGRVARTGQV